MPIKSGKLTRGEKAFITHMAATGDKTYSATKAGYNHPREMGQQVAARPAVQAEIVATQTALLFELGLPLAVKTHLDLLTSPAVPPGAKVQAVKLMYDRTLGAEGSDKTLEPHEMTPEQLARAIASLEQVAAERARPIADVEPSTLDVEPETIDERPGLFD